MKPYTMEEKDRLEQVLRGKLEDFRAEPPADMWSRIENTLAEQRRTEAFAAAETKRKSLRRRIWTWSVSTAAVLSLLSVAGYQYHRMHTSVGMMAEALTNTAIVEETAPSLAVATELSQEHAVADQQGLRQQSIEAERPAVRKVRYTHTEQPEPKLETAVMAENFPATNKAQSLNLSSESPVVMKSRATDATPEFRQEDESNQSDKQSYSARDTRKESEERWNRMVAAERMRERRKNRRSGVSAALYAANFGGGSSSQTVQGVARLNASSFMVDEVVQRVENSNQIVLYTSSRTQKLKHRMPITTGLSVNVGVLPRLSIETGLTYSYLHSESEANGTWNYAVKQKLHYLGIPLAIRYDLVDGGRFGLYASAGGAVEKCVSGIRTIKVSSEGSVSGAPEKEHLGVKGVQPSIGAALGGELRFAERFGIYIEPGVGYYFENAKQPESYRTEHPCNFTLKAGLRISFR